jgi:putative endonuclease
MSYYTYIIQNSISKKDYIGYTANLIDRLKRHNSGRNVSTRTQGEWILVYKEKFDEKKIAWLRERKIKRYKGGNAFKALIKQ